MLDELEIQLTVTDLKQYIYCPRILYYHYCLPQVHPTTYKMQAGIEAGREEKLRAHRRTFAAYSLGGLDGERHFDVPVASTYLGMTGIIDEVVEVASPKAELIPVDYKLARTVGYHFKLQLTAYAMLLEDTYHLPVRRAFLYLISLRRAEAIPITKALRAKLLQALMEIREAIQWERMPPPVATPSRCTNCEFRRFCNDV